MKRLMLIGFLSLAVVGSSFAAKPKKMKGDDLSNMVIEGENRLKAHGDVPPLEWSPELYRDVEESLKSVRVPSGLKAPALKDPPIIYEGSLNSPIPATPWLEQIYEAPILTLKTKPSKGEDNKVEWLFKVKDSHGKTFFEKRKKSVLPSAIEWDGMGKGSRPLHVGFDYSYTLFIVDEAGNPQRYAGKPFNVKSYRYQKGSKDITHLYPEIVFADPSSLRVSKEGMDHLIEVKDQIRLNHGEKIEVNVYDRDPRFASARAKVIQDFLLETLVYPEDKIVANGLKTREGEGYRYVEIVEK